MYHTVVDLYMEIVNTCGAFEVRTNMIQVTCSMAFPPLVVIWAMLRRHITINYTQVEMP